MKTFLLNLKNWISRVFAAMIGNSKDETNSIDDIPNPNKYFESSIEINTIEKDQDVPKTFRQILSEIGKVGENFRKAGISDGMLSMNKSAIDSIVSDSVRRTRAYVETIFKGLEQEVKTILGGAESLRSQANDLLKINEKYLGTLTKAYQWRPNSFSSLLGMFYVGVGLMLIVADAILSFKITNQGFDLTAPHEKYGMAIGIALCAVYIKIYFDMYILPSLERSVTMFKKENLPGITDNSDDIERIKTVWKIRFGFNTFLFALCLVTIIALGYFRFKFINYMVEEKEILNQVLTQGEFSNGTLNLPKNPVDLKSVTKWAFILLALLFPLIGGICGAMGVHKIRNRIILAKARYRYKKAQKKLIKQEVKVSALEQQLASYECYLDWCEEEGAFIKDTTSYYKDCYYHGYEHGFQKRNINLDLFQRALEMRKQYAAHTRRLNH